MKRKFDPNLVWTSSKDDIINDFYKPAFENCTLYQRLSGYFSSSTFANIVEEILGFIENNGKIQLITSKELSETDKEIFEQSVNDRDGVLSRIFLEDLKNDLQNTQQDFYKIMAYMLTNQIDGKPQLEIKIAVPKRNDALYHHKIGIMRYNNEEKIAFTGSINETGMGWHRNVESFTVFKSWTDDNTTQQGIIQLQRTFNDLWNNNEKNVPVIDLPKAVKEEIFKIRPKSNDELQETIKRVQKMIQKNKENTQSQIEPDARIKLRAHQNEAIKKWNENRYHGLLEMATGTGKTFTAFGCMSMIQQMHNRTIVIIACPQKHLVEQWSKEIKKWNRGVSPGQKINVDYVVTCHSDYKWQREFNEVMSDLTSKPLGFDNYITNHVVIFTTHKTLQHPILAQKIFEAVSVKKFLIIDEVHNVTKEASSVILRKEFDFRLGLSATPTRHLDDEGTNILQKYFRGIPYKLDLNDAIHKLGILSTYDYIPYYVELTKNEMVEYHKLTRKIAQNKIKKQKYVIEKDFERMDPAILRSDLVANAENKYKELGKILDNLNNNLKQTLIYCTNNPSSANPFDSPRQLERVQKILTGRGIVSDSITWEDKTKDKHHILNLMTRGHFDCVTAVKCLDEGIDVPTVKTGIFMASSGNPKQFIQRRGRVLRKSEAEGKTHACIYDILVTPPIMDLNSEFGLSQRKLMARELFRHKEFALIASNKDQAVLKIQKIADLFKIDFNKLNNDYIQNMK